MLVILKSATNKLPEESNAIPNCAFSVLAVVPLVPVVKLDCPSTSVAASPSVKGASYLSMRLLLLSTTHKFPDESNAKCLGADSVLAVVPLVPVVKLDCPSTSVAACPFSNATAISYVKRIDVKTKTNKIFLVKFNLFRSN